MRNTSTHTHHKYSLTHTHTNLHPIAQKQIADMQTHVRLEAGVCIPSASRPGTGVEVNIFFLSSPLYCLGSRGGRREVSWACRCFALWQAGCGEHGRPLDSAIHQMSSSLACPDLDVLPGYCFVCLTSSWLAPWPHLPWLTTAACGTSEHLFPHPPPALPISCSCVDG